MNERACDLEAIEARNDAIRALLAAGWGSRRIALALGMRDSWDIAFRVMYLGASLDLTALEKAAAE
jgi:hypothetical protein